MSHDHIGIPKFLEQEFANDGKVYCYDLVRDKGYQTSIFSFDNRHQRIMVL